MEALEHRLPHVLRDHRLGLARVDDDAALGLLLGVLFAFRKLATTSELDIMRAVGLGYTRLLRVPYAIAAVLIAAMYIHDIRPGPMLMVENPSFLYQVVAMLLLATLANLVFGLSLTKLFIKVLMVPRERLMAGGAM